MQKPSKLAQTPQIRFAEFTDPWERCKLIDYLDVSRNKNKEEIFGKEDVLSVSGDYGIVNQIEFQGRSFAGVSVVNYGVVDSGDVVYTKSPLKLNPYGIIKMNKGKPGIVSTLYAVYKPKDNVYSEFIQIYFEQDARMNNYMHPLVNKGAKNDMKVSDENALQGEVCFPEREEQEKISTYFQSLDNLITLHQSKFEKLQKIKKSCLQNLFPQNNQNTPKIRFKNFSDEWVESRLGELGNILTGSTPPTNISELYDNNGIPWVTPTDITSNLISKTCKRLSKKGELVSRIVPSKTILVTYIASIGKNAMLLTRGSFNQQINSLTVNDNNDPYFMLTQSSLWSEQMKKQAAQATMQIVNKTEFSNIKAYIPNLTEQEKIGAFFTKLDKLITLQQRKVEKLKNIKKALLNKMFI